MSFVRTLVAFVLLRGDAATAARPKRRREQKGTRLRDAASWLSEASRLHMSGAAPEEVLSALVAALAIDPLHAKALCELLLALQGMCDWPA